MSKAVRAKSAKGPFTRRTKLILVSVIAIAIVLALVAVEYQPTKKAKPNGNNNGNGDRPPASGDWLVEKAITVETENLVVNGNITINANGKLWLRNSTLQASCHKGMTFRVVDGGELHIIHSEITHSEPETQCDLWVEGTSKLEMKDSKSTVILVLTADGAVVEKNIFTGKYAGILVYSDSNVISGNTITGSDSPFLANAIYLANVTKNAISNNQLSGFGSGITLINASGNTFTRNSITSNNANGQVTGSGIQFDRSNDNTITYNNITGCEQGVSLLNSTNNLFHHNNFKNNQKQVQDDGTNRFDDGTDGNYWSDYIGFDLNKDGKGDLPYLISFTDRDNHPLIKPVP